MERFALPAWREWEACWKIGEISSRECLSRQVELIRADRQTLVAFAETLPLDEGFLEIERACAERGIPLTIVSDGLDLIVETVLRRHRLTHIPFFANHLTWTAEGTPALEFPYAAADCPKGAGTCKCALTRAARLSGARSVYIGDGQSDYCVAAHMPVVFAKGALRGWCARARIAFHAIETLYDVSPILFPRAVPVP